VSSTPPSTGHDTSDSHSRSGGRVFSTDHRTIGLQYFFLSMTAVLIGTLLSLLMRVHIVWPEMRIPFLGEIKPETYLAFMTMHGTLMIFFVLSTAPLSAFGNLILPSQIGSRRMAFPTLNMLSLWTTVLSFIVMVAALFVTGGGPTAGWTQYPPLSALAAASPGQGLGMDLWIISIGIFCLASLMSAINFIATTLRLRTKGMTLMRMPLTVWSWFVTSMLVLLAFSVLLAAVLLLFSDRHWGTSFFIPVGLVLNGVPVAVKRAGGSPLLWQHLFWFFGHPEVYIAILPGMGVTSHLISTFSRKRIFGYRSMVYAMLSIGVLGFLVWGHHMFVAGMNPYYVMAFSTLTLVIAVPSGVKTINWLATLWRGHIRFTTPLLFSVGFVSLFITGGLSGPILAQPEVDRYLHDTYFVVAHFHLIMGMAGVFALFAATYFWFPKMFADRLMDERLGNIHFWMTFIGAYATFMPMHFLGMAGHPRRYSQILGSADYLQRLLPLQRFITIAAIVLITAQLIFLFNLFRSMRKGKFAGANPWESTTLEWVTPISGERIIVSHGPYEFGTQPGSSHDFVLQSDSPHITSNPGDAAS
jgi:cytochrome c oxidase subunit 1